MLLIFYRLRCHLGTTSVLPLILSRECKLPLGHIHASGKIGILYTASVNVRKAWTETMHAALILGTANHLPSTPPETPNAATRNPHHAFHINPLQAASQEEFASK